MIVIRAHVILESFNALLHHTGGIFVLRSADMCVIWEKPSVALVNSRRFGYF